MKKLAPAKVNLCLKILNRRKDGFHNLISVFQTVSLFDKIKIDRISDNKIQIDCNIKSLANKSNLCYKVAELLKKWYKIKSGVKIKIEKNIPLGSGLGGASTDAYATAEMLVKLWKIKINKKKLVELCSSLGKDIPFFAYKGSCIVKGTGEKIFPINPWWKNKKFYILLIYPNKILLTKEVYKKFSQMNVENKSVKINNLLREKSFKNLMFNDLFLPATKIFPKLILIKNFMQKCGLEIVNMSGSGSTMYGICDSLYEAKKIAVCLKTKLKDIKVMIVKPIF